MMMGIYTYWYIIRLQNKNKLNHCDIRSYKINPGKIIANVRFIFQQVPILFLNILIYNVKEYASHVKLQRR